jgi:hypothetical protein
MTARLTCAEAEPLLGVLVLGAIDPSERAGVELHLGTCDRCATTFTELAVLPGLLLRVDVDDIADGIPPVSPDFTARLLAAGSDLTREREQRRRRTTAWVAVAAAALVVALGVAVPVVLHRAGAGATVAQGAPMVVHGAQAAVTASVTMVPQPTGTSLSLTLQGVEPGEHCQLVALDPSGHREVASTWVANYEGEATVEGSTSLTQSQVTSLLVETTDGRTLVALPVPHPA